MRLHIVSIALAAFILVSSGTRLLAQYNGYMPNFPTTGGSANLAYGTNLSPAHWCGGDGGSAVPLDSVSAFWAFSDTYIGNPYKNPNVRVGNTIAIGVSQNGTFKPTYIYRGTASNPLPFFMDPANPYPNPTPGTPGFRFWTQKPFSDTFNPTNTLYVFLRRIQDNPDLSFNSYDTAIARITNATAAPENWNIDLLFLTQSYGNPLNAYYGDDAFLYGGYLIAYGQYAPPGGIFRTVAIRIPMTVLTSAPPGNSYIGNNVQYLTQSNNWAFTNVGLVGTDSQDVGIPSTSGFSSRYHPGLNQWQAVYIRSNPAFSPPLGSSVLAMTAPGPFGPWSPPVAIYNIPQAWANSYTASEKPAYASNPENRILFTLSIPEYYGVYACEVANPFYSSPYSTKRSYQSPTLGNPGPVVSSKAGTKIAVATEPIIAPLQSVASKPTPFLLPTTNQAGQGYQTRSQSRYKASRSRVAVKPAK